jgi:hypothetical protein
MTTYKDFESIITKKVHVQENTTQHNTLCSSPGCYSNCHENCNLDFTLDPSGLLGCAAMSSDGKCRCGHGLDLHRHYHCIWKLVDDRQVVIDHSAKKNFNNAKDMKTRKQQLLEAVKKARDTLTNAIDAEMTELAGLVEEFSRLSLTGSFSGQVHKSVRLLELNLEAMRASAADEDTIRKMEQSLETLTKQLDVLRRAESKAKSGFRKFLRI